MIANTTTQPLLPLEDVPSHGRTHVNESVWFVDHDGYGVVFRWHEPLYRVALDDTVQLRLVAVNLRLSELATQEEIARAFGHAVATQRRWEQGYQQEGINGLVPKGSPGHRRQLNKSQNALVRKWFEAGVSNRQMAKRLGVGEAAVRRTLKRLGLRRAPEQTQRRLPLVGEESPRPAAAEKPPGMDDGRETQGEPQRDPQVEASGEPPGEDAPLRGSWTIDSDPHDRSGDRTLARMGLLEDAQPLFAEAEAIPRAGVLLAVPLRVGAWGFGGGVVAVAQAERGRLRAVRDWDFGLRDAHRGELASERFHGRNGSTSSQRLEESYQGSPFVRGHLR